MDQLPFLLNSFGDRYLHEVNRGLFNQLGSAAVYRRHYGERLTATDTLTIVLGTDSAMLIRHVQRIGVPEGSRFLFVELENLLPLIEAELAGEELGERITLCAQSALNDGLIASRFTDYANIGAIQVLESIGAVDANIPEYRQLVAEARQQIDALLWTHSSLLGNPTFIRSQLQNLLEAHTPAAVLRDSFADKTAVLLGGGPSLDAMLEWLKEHRDHVVIVAVSRIARRLRQVGLTPHILVSVDPTELSFDVSREFLQMDPRVVFAHANHVHYPLLAQWPGRSVYLGPAFPWRVKSEADNIDGAGPTVTNTAFALICAMGFGQVIFGGIDLCHSSAGHSHARGSNEHDAGPRLGGAVMRVPTNGGRLAETTPDFYNAIRSFGLQIAAAGTRTTALNPFADAAVIDGVTFRPLDDIALTPLMEDPFTLLHQHLPDAGPGQRRSRFAAMRKQLARANGRLRQVIRLTEEALACNDGLFGRNGKTADFKYKKRMDKIERELDTRLKDVSQIVRALSTRAFLQMPPSDRDWTDEELESAGNTYYNAYRDNARQLLEMVETASQRLRVGLIEEDEAPDFDTMFAQWQRDGIPGRGRVWLHRHPEAANRLSAAVRESFETLSQAFEGLLHEQDTEHTRKVRREASLAPVRGKLQLLFREGNTTELGRINDQLERIDNDEARQLTQLARGYIAELNDDGEAAFDEYAALIDLVRGTLKEESEGSANARLEDGLGRMVVIAMAAEQHEQALLILQTLADIAISYKAQFAELLRLTGNIEQAAAVYTEYLALVPNDLVSMLRLGKLYQSIGSKEAARTAFDYVLQQEPENTAARALLEQLDNAA